MISLSSNGKPERWYWAVVEWWQLKCGPGNVVDVLERREKHDHSRRGEGKLRSDAARDVDLEKGAASPVVFASPARKESVSAAAGVGQWRLRLRKVYLAVPAFASPLTPVLNPLVGRAQWEIVVRSAFLSMLVSCVVVGGLVAAPETHR